MERKTRTKKKKRLKGDDDLIMGRKKKDTDMMVMKQLDPDMHLEIVSRLPFKEAVQCRCVCKSWRTLLHDNFLINIHAKTQLKLDGYDHQHAHGSSSSSSSSTIVSFISFPEEEPPSLFGFYDDNLCSYKESSFNNSSPKLEDATMINSCNGLICLNIDYNESIAIYNPVTTEFMRLPWDVGYRHVGFGYNPSTKEYKILRTISIEGSTSSHCHQIYTLGTTCGWRNIKEPSFDYQLPGVHVNGTLYWITEYGGSLIMSFDLADEEFRLLSMLPPLLNNMKPKPPHYKLVESQGCLFLFVDQYSSADDPHIELWVMKEKENVNDYGYRYHWSNLMEISTVGHHEKEDYEFLALTQSGKALFWHNGVLTCFDPKTERFASIRDMPSPPGGYSYEFDIIPHTNSLVSLIALGAIPKKKKKKTRRKFLGIIRQFRGH